MMTYFERCGVWVSFVVMIGIGIAACGGGEDEESESKIKLDKDHNGVCDSDLNWLDTGCGDQPSDSCPVPELTSAECDAICAKVKVLGTDRDSDCFSSPDEAVWLLDDELCPSNCRAPILACVAVESYCYKDADTCADVKQCRIDTMR